jgi:hypothetical protein
VTTALGIAALLVGSLAVVGQLISVFDFKLAQRWGLQEKDEYTDTLHRRLELSTARWDVVVLWTLPLAGVAMLLDTSWWPWVALIAGGVWVDAGGREYLKWVALRDQGVRIGAEPEIRLGRAFLALMVALGLALIVHSLVVVS